MDGAMQTTKYMIELGGLLKDIQDKMSEDEFILFVQDNLDMPYVHAMSFIQKAKDAPKLLLLPFGVIQEKIGSEKKPRETKEVNSKVIEGLVDMTGRPLPPKAALAFARVDELKELYSSLAAVQRICDSGVTGDDVLYKFVVLGPLKAAIGDVKRQIKDAMPFAVCPYCGADEDNESCKPCRSAGWVTKRIWDAIPDDMKIQENKQ